MRDRILAVVDELKRRKADGEEMIFVDPRSVDALREAVGKKASKESASETSQTVSAPASYVPIASTVNEPLAANEYAHKTPRVERPARTAPVKEAPKPSLPPPPSFTVPDGDKQERWEWLRERVLNCPVCNANLNSGKRVVFGAGNINSSIFFCGEAPGGDEEIQGIPFVGKAGQLLVKIISAMGLSREDVYIGNIMNWRPQTGRSTGNRPPTEEEMAFCLPYLRAQVDIVQPKVIVALGNTAITGLLGPDPKRRLGKIRGTWFDFKGTPLMPTYHPSYVLQYGSNTTKRQIWEDMLAVMEKVGIPISEKQQNFFRV